MSDDLPSNSTVEPGLTLQDLTQNSHVVIGGDYRLSSRSDKEGIENA